MATREWGVKKFSILNVLFSLFVGVLFFIDKSPFEFATFIFLVFLINFNIGIIGASIYRGKTIPYTPGAKSGFRIEKSISKEIRLKMFWGIILVKVLVTSSLVLFLIALIVIP